MNKCTEKYFSIHSFSLYGPHIWKKNIEDIIGINRFNLLCKENNGRFA